MRLLLVAATAAEVQPISASFQSIATVSSRLSQFGHARHEIDVLVTGVGMVATATWCARVLSERRPDAALNVGLCGSFNPAYPPPAVVHVVSDCLTELGAEDAERFLSIHDLGFLAPDDEPFRAGHLVNTAPPASSTLQRLPSVRGITVNTVHGHEPSIACVVERVSPDVESMEGAAFLYACLTAGVPCAQIRAVSNRVERRNRESWMVADALSALSSTARAVIAEL